MRLALALSAILSSTVASAAGYDVRTTSTAGAVAVQCAQSASVSGTSYTFAGVTAGACTTAPPPPPTSCPAGRYTQGTGWYNYEGRGSILNYTLASTLFSPPAYGPPRDFPFVNSHGVTISGLPRSGYIAAQFTVPANQSTSATGSMTHGSTASGPPLDAAISRNCGDFAYSGLCGYTNATAGTFLAKWKISNPSYPYNCSLAAGQTYYINIRIHDPQTAWNGCGAASCMVSVQANNTP